MKRLVCLHGAIVEGARLLGDSLFRQLPHRQLRRCPWSTRFEQQGHWKGVGVGRRGEQSQARPASLRPQTSALAVGCDCRGWFPHVAGRRRYHIAGKERRVNEGKRRAGGSRDRASAWM